MAKIKEDPNLLSLAIAFTLLCTEKSPSSGPRCWLITLSHSITVFHKAFSNPVPKLRTNHYVCTRHLCPKMTLLRLIGHTSSSSSSSTPYPKGLLGHHRWFHNQFRSFFSVLHCPLGLGQLQGARIWLLTNLVYLRTKQSILITN